MKRLLLVMAILVGLAVMHRRLPRAGDVGLTTAAIMGDRTLLPPTTVGATTIAVPLTTTARIIIRRLLGWVWAWPPASDWAWEFIKLS